VVSPRQEGALGPAHEDGRWVRRLGIDGVAEIDATHSDGGLPEGGSGGRADKWHLGVRFIGHSHEGNTDHEL
jgi:hypothetical protein